ncbi:MAG: GntR family transcriptional regulator [Clostridia bacterium]|nr:GntR family transcriptional regulator [Clostridia bacterium]
MELDYKINPDMDVPIYQQLVDVIRNSVKKGELASGEQLPTVSEMTERLGIARGTIKRAYDELERAGLIEKVQGRGTFVRYQPENSGSRKEQAMAAIDAMLDSLEDMGLSPSEINIFLNLKLRERAAEEAHIKVAVVECNPENLSQVSEQLRHISGVDLYSYMLENVRQYPYKLSEEFDLIVTTPSHAEYLESVLPVKKKIARMALRPSARCLADIIKLTKGEKVGIVGYSKRFGELMYETCMVYNEDVVLFKALELAADSDIEAYLKGKDAVLVPKSYEKYFSQEAVDVLKRYDGDIIDCFYEMDEGTVMYLEAKIKKLLDSKTI